MEKRRPATLMPRNEPNQSEDGWPRLASAARLAKPLPPASASSPVSKPLGLKADKWRLAVDVPAKAKNLESCLHAVERMPSGGRQPRFVPIRFAITSRPTGVDKLMLAFDAQVLAEAPLMQVDFGRMIYGKDCASQRVKTFSMAGKVQKLMRR